MEPKLHLIGNAHLDPVWLWNWQEGYMEVLATIRSALDRLNESEDFIFTCSSARYYKWVEEADPAMFEEIRQRVKEGRWIIVGGWWIQPDDNMPSGESFARQALYSQKYYQEKFGITCKTGYCVDTFGHSAELPKLLQEGGMENFVFMRPDKHENADIPNLFWWKAMDGSQVLTMKLVTPGYNRTPDAEELKQIAQMGDELGADMTYFYGVGNHGGGPTRKHIARLREINENEMNGRMCFSSPDHYFAAVRAQAPQLPTWKNELQHHASGCYSAASAIKKSLRTTENTLLSAEKFASLARALGIAPDRAEELREAWDNVMFNQFHDIMCGCSVKSALDDALDMYAQSRAVGTKLLHKSLGLLCKQINTQIDGVTGAGKENWQIWEEADNGVPTVLFNPHAYPVKYYQQVNAQLATVCNDRGEALPLQYVYGDSVNGDDKYDTLFPAEIPAFGYAVYWVYKNRVVNPDLPREFGTKAQFPETYCLENDLLTVSFDEKTGWITGMKEKTTGKELLAAPSGIPVIVDDTEYDTWAHAQFTFRKDLEKLQAVRISFTEKGCNRSGIRVQYEYHGSQLWVDYLLYQGSAKLDVKVKALWQSPFTQLKLAFTPALADCRSIAEIPYGVIRRPSNGEEFPMLRWCGLEGLDKNGEAAGFVVANDGKYSYDALDNELRVTLLRNCMYADHFGRREDTLYDFVDEGVQYASLTLMPCDPNALEQASMAADLLNCAPVAVFDTYHKGTLPRQKSFAAVDSPAVALTALKSAEDGDGMILRLAECSGKAVTCKVSSELLGLELDLSFAPLEVKTWKVSKNGIKETNFLE